MREFIQNKLNELETIECGPYLTDDVLMDNDIYFGYEIQETFQSEDFDKNATLMVSIIGYVSMKDNNELNVLKIVDNSKNLIINKLKEIGFRCSYKDVSIDNGIKKMQISAYAYYNEINKKIF